MVITIFSGISLSLPLFSFLFSSFLFFSFLFFFFFSFLPFLSFPSFFHNIPPSSPQLW